MEINGGNVKLTVESQVLYTKKMDEKRNIFSELSTKEIQEITDNADPVMTKRSKRYVSIKFCLKSAKFPI